MHGSGHNSISLFVDVMKIHTGVGFVPSNDSWSISRRIHLHVSSMLVKAPALNGQNRVSRHTVLVAEVKCEEKRVERDGNPPQYKSPKLIFEAKPQIMHYSDWAL